MEFEEQVLKAQAGDDEAFYDLMSTSKEMLYKIAFTYVKDKEAALDAVSETVFKAYTNIKKLKNPQFFKTWLIRILINYCLSYLKKNKIIVLLDEQSVLPSKGDNDNCEEAMDLRNSIGKLNEKYKNIIILKYYHSLTLTEIAQILDYPVGTVKTNLHKALKALRIDLKQEVLYE